MSPKQHAGLEPSTLWEMTGASSVLRLCFRHGYFINLHTASWEVVHDRSRGEPRSRHGFTDPLVSMSGSCLNGLTASGGAGFNRGTMYTEQGVLVASVAEGLIRDVAEKVCLIGLNRWDNPLQFANQGDFSSRFKKRPNSTPLRVI